MREIQIHFKRTEAADLHKIPVHARAKQSGVWTNKGRA